METARSAFAAAAGLLLAVGLLMVYSASITSRPTEFESVYLGRQALFLGVALACGWGAAMVPARWWRLAAPWLFAGTLLLLTLVLVPGIGTAVKGARRWLRWGGCTLQPSEFAKLTTPLFVCWLAADGRWRLRGLWRSLPPLGLVGVALGLVLFEPDLGTTLFLAGLAGIGLFASGWPLRWFALLLGPTVPLALATLVMRPYQWARVQGFLAVWTDFRSAPYQVRQSLTTLGAGGLWGSGLGLGEQKLSFLPEANTDFVFAVIGEELGLVGTLGVLCLWVALYGLGLKLLAPLRRGSFEQALGLTLLTGLVLQAALNMAVVLALVPPKGISLPLISYGGSNLVVSVTLVGLLLSLTRPPAARSAAPLPESCPPLMAAGGPAAGR